MKKFFQGEMSPVNIRNNMIYTEKLCTNPYTKGIDRYNGPWIGHIDTDNAHKLIESEDPCDQKTEHRMQTNERRHPDKYADRKSQCYSVRRFFNAEDLPEFIPEVRNAGTPVQ